MAGDVRIDARALEVFLTSPTGPVGEWLAKQGARGSRIAKGYAPVSPHGSHGRAPGHLKSVITWHLGRDSHGLHVDITSPARTNDRRKAPYGLFMSLHVLRGAHGGLIRTTPHLQPALRDLVASL